ncbi:hypothetical protein QUF76_02740 [Desulfobacterales bacterium HSG16]|nr:hypothetical protein [Desulfobacterales bacterium HSG16]
MMTDRNSVIMFRSFIMSLYDSGFKLCENFIFPLTMIAPFGNRIFRELIPDKLKTAREPWYYFVPYFSEHDPVKRSTHPIGPTSLCGRQYFPEKEPLPRAELHPDTFVTGFKFIIYDFKTVLFEGEYFADDIFQALAEYLGRKQIEKGRIKMEDSPFYYKVDVQPHEVRTVPDDLFPPEAYDVEGVFRLPQLSKTRKRTKFRKIVPEPFPVRDFTYYSHTQTAGRGRPGENRIIMKTDVYHALLEKIEFSKDIEMGGFLAGYPFRQPNSPENEDDPEYRWQVEITDLIEAEGAWGKPLSLLFTGDTWSRSRIRMDKDFKGKELVSWFHTHLFRATDDFGLSGWDIDLHERFLTRPWQVAVLVNIGKNGDREVRCFQRWVGGELDECLFEVID